VQDDLSMALEQMGSRAEEVAATLRATGVQGARNTVRVLNPVVRYVQNALRRDNLEADVMTGALYGSGFCGIFPEQPLFHRNIPCPEPSSLERSQLE
jgi:hypothetical protein